MQNPRQMFAFRQGALRLSIALSASIAFAAPAFAENNIPMDEPADWPAIGDWGVATDQISTTVKPGDDFYLYVNEGWLNSAQMPAGFGSYDAFVKAYLNTEKQLEKLINDTTSQPQKDGSMEQKIGAIFTSFQDMEQRNRLGLSPIRIELNAIAKAKTRADIVRLMSDPTYSAFVDTGVFLDRKSPQNYAYQMAQSGLSLPSPEYYLSTAEPFIGHRKAFVAYAAGVFERAGLDRPTERAAALLALETDIAKAHWSNVERRDAVKSYRAMTPAELAQYAPGFDWATFLKRRGVAGQAKLILTTDTAVQKLSSLFANTPVDDLKSFLAFHLIDGLAPFLAEDWQKANFQFYSGQLRGVTEQRPLRAQAIAFTSQVFGQGLGRAYVERYFDPANKDKINQMVGYMRLAFKERIAKLEWMDEPTRAEALGKLAKVTSEVGFPGKWSDYSALRLEGGDLVGNLKRLSDFRNADELAKLSETRRDWEWPYVPQDINAGYQPSYNRVVFPAAILQPPFYDPNADIAVNFGAIAAVIGHELGHGFDDQGSASDGDGLLRNWWTPEAREQFNRRTAKLVAQYEGYSPIAGVSLNGKLTLGENIGDLGGLTIAHDAYRRFVTERQGSNAPVLGGFTGDQRFFLAWAQTWQSIVTPDIARQKALTDNHSPGKFRTNGVVRNIDAWYDAFGVNPGDDLYLAPEDRVRIW